MHDRTSGLLRLTRAHLAALALASGLTTLAGGPALAAKVPAAEPASQASAPLYTGNIIVRWRDAPTPAAKTAGAAATPAGQDRLQALSSETGIALSVKRQMGSERTLLAPAAAGADPEAVAARLRQDPRVADAVPDRWLRPFDTMPNDPDFATRQPYLMGPTQVPGGANLPAAWDRGRGSADVVVAVIDTGILRHGDLAARLLPGYDFISDPAVALDGDGRDADPTDAGDNVPQGYACPGLPAADRPEPNSWHGTRVSGVLGAVTDNGQAIAGVDWQARLLPLRVSGRCGAQLSDTIDAMRWAGGLPVPGLPDNPTPARVVNISLGGGSCSTFEQEAIDELAARGVVVVAAAGNNAGAVEAPASCRGTVAVTAHVDDGENASYASVGPEVTLSAPGGGCGVSQTTGSAAAPVCLGPISRIRTLSNTGTTTPGSDTVTDSQGTSFASPIAAGVASMMLAVNAGLSPSQVIGLLRQSARPHPAGTYCDINAGTCGAGLLDAGRALQAAVSTVPGGVEPPPPTTTTPPPAAGGDDGGGGAVAPLAGLVLLLVGFAAAWRPGSRRR
ncbi:S8 family peptidase [Cupriavidus sp. AU9028]|nr:S8 family peptidase [Cupriavidus sp. AU9028]